jgi:hypothetical protein
MKEIFTECLVIATNTADFYFRKAINSPKLDVFVPNFDVLGVIDEADSTFIDSNNNDSLFTDRNQDFKDDSESESGLSTDHSNLNSFLDDISTTTTTNNNNSNNSPYHLIY